MNVLLRMWVSLCLRIPKIRLFLYRYGKTLEVFSKTEGGKENVTPIA